MPTFNRAHLLHRSIGSLVQQTFKNFDVFICDDGSTDETRLVVESYKNILNINWKYCKNSGGPASPRNIGIKASKSKYIAFLDADDWWTPTKLEISLNYLKNGYDFIYHDLMITNDSLSNLGILKSRTLTYPYYNDLLLNGNAINCSSVICKSTIFDQVGLFDTHNDCIAAEDFDMWIRISKNGFNFKKISGHHGFYRLHSSNISSYLKTFKYTKYIYNKYKQDIQLLSKLIPRWIVSNIVKYYIKRVISY